jgi:hypothetical protein
MADTPILINLALTPENVEAQCAEAIKQARNTSHALAALITLQTFIAATVQPSHKFTPAYETVKAVVERHAAEMRARILAESADALAGAFRQQNRQEIARIHASLSRNGFWQMAQQAASQLGDSELVAAAAWARDWCREAKASAEAASGFPDALDFRKAGISAAEYTAMTEISRYLTEAIR